MKLVVAFDRNMDPAESIAALQNKGWTVTGTGKRVFVDVPDGTPFADVRDVLGVKVVEGLVERRPLR